VRRRDFIALLGGAAMGPLAVRAQQRQKLIGILLFDQQDKPVIGPFLQDLQSLGYFDGGNVVIAYRDAGGQYERLPQLAAELVGLEPDVIFSFGSELAPIVKSATASIPIVVVVSNDPVASGLVASLSRPGGNVTGVTYIHDQLAGKTIELLKEAVPRVSRVAILWNPDHNDPEFRETQRGAPALGIQLQSLEVRQSADFNNAFKMATQQRAEALIVVGSRIIALHRQWIGDFSTKNRLILVGTPKWISEAGGLLTYGPDVLELNRRAARYVDKILKGARPGDLPMQQPVTFELTISLKTAKGLGLTIPPTLLALADEVIE
jgi:putative tryptophan/tyrosine transport system substrate-binding protein